jgi:hypothetical protein
MPVAAVEAPIQVDHTQVRNYTSVMALGWHKSQDFQISRKV